jgi:hypothetical protein
MTTIFADPRRADEASRTEAIAKRSAKSRADASSYARRSASMTVSVCDRDLQTGEVGRAEPAHGVRVSRFDVATVGVLAGRLG